MKISFKIIRNDSPYFIGAYNANLEDPAIMLNVEAYIDAYKDEQIADMTEAIKDGFLQTLTHEFCHAMQQFLNKEFDELEVEKTLELYNAKWNVFKAQDDGEENEPSFSLRQLIEFIRGDKSITADELKSKIEHIFKPYINWIDAEDKYIQTKDIPSI